MKERRSLAQSNQLEWCAILGCFDEPTLIEIAGGAPAEVQELMASDQVETASDGYRLREEVQRTILSGLRHKQARDEIELHAQAFYFFLQRKEHAQSAAEQLAGEDRCFEHLAALHHLFVEHVEWNAILPYLDAIRVSTLRRPQHADWLTFYEAHVAIRTDRLEAGIALLEGLLAREDIEPALRIRALHACGIAYSDLPRFDDSLRLLEEADRLAAAHGDLFYQGYARLIIGMIYNDLDDHMRALAYSEQSLELFRQIGAVYREAHALYEISNNALRMGNWERARVALDESAALYTALKLTNRLSMIAWAQGMLYQMLGDEAQSEAAYNRALEVALTPTATIPSIAMDSLAQLGLLYQMQGRYDEAQEAYQRALGLAERHGYQHRKPIFRYRLGELLCRRNQITEAAAVYREAIDNVEELRSQTEAQALKISLLGTTAHLYESMVLFCLKHETPALAFEYVERSRARAFLDILDRQSPHLYAAFDQPTAPLAEVQACLEPDEVLIEYFTIGLLPAGDHWLARIPSHNQRLRQHVRLPPQILIFAVTRNTLHIHQIDVDPNKLRPSAHSDDPVLQMLRIDGTARWLYDRLIQPVEHLLGSCRQLFLIPHGPLHYIPFTALRAADGTFLLKAGGPAIAFSPSATLLVRNCRNRSPSQATRNLAIGYNHQEGRRLDHAEAEARLVAGLIGGECWVGPESKSEQLIAIGSQVRWLHIAGHASYHHQAALTSSLQLGAQDTLDAATVMSSLTLDADLVTLSSCMSGFSQVVPGDELLGLQRAFLYAGTPTVVCTLAKTRDTVAALVMEQFYTRLLDGIAAATALRDALVAVRMMTREQVIEALHRLGYPDSQDIAGPTSQGLTEQDAREQPFAKPEYWAPFVLIGRP